HGLPRSMDLAYADWFLRWIRAGASPAALAALERMNAQIDIRDILPTIRVPTLVMNRIGDPIANAAAARDLAARIPGAVFREFPGETHSMFLIEPENVLATIAEFITGTPHQLSSARVLATILFLDIVGSTERAAELGDAGWTKLLGRFYAGVEGALQAHGGVIVDRAGDGMLATFDGPARAIRGARAALEEAKVVGLRLRAGVHTGEVERDGAAIRGIAVHIAARIASLAESDELLVSGTVRDLVAGSGIAFRDRGLHKLKGVPEPRHQYLVLSA
ncbi:MAG TPA: adenylate/guanylate cyclase domain-containing protein, partial [Candidatus Acidoferrales bacterium]|nr:adenylate/guanylate cyclase domain-containing protein [Candidatus Acidoferrales bacterium]